MSAAKGAPAPDTSLAKSSPAPITVLLKKYSTAIRESLPKHVPSDYLLRVSINLITRSKNLLDCSEMSLVSCIVECAQLGLPPDTVQGLIYLVPFKKKATIIVGYQGFQRLIYNDGAVSAIETFVHREGDVFDIQYGSDPKIIHKPNPKRDPKDSEALWKGVYSVGRYANGMSTFEYLTREDVFARRAKSAAFNADKKDSPWFTDPISMWRKSAIRAIARKLPKSVSDNRLARAVALDVGMERGNMRPTGSLQPFSPGTGFEFAPEADQMLAGDDPANAGDLKQAKETKETFSVSTKAEEKKAGDVIDVQPKGDKPSDATVAGAKPPKANIPKTIDPVIKKTSDLWNKGVANGWKIEEIQKFIRQKYNCALNEVRESMRADIVKAMEGGADGVK